MILYSKGQNIMDHLAGHMTMSRFASPPLKLVCRLHACPHISLKSPSTLVSIFHAVLSMYSVWFSFGSSARSKKKNHGIILLIERGSRFFRAPYASSTTCRPDSVSHWKSTQAESANPTQGLHYTIYQRAPITIIGWKSVKDRQNRSVKGPKFKKTKIDNLSSIINAIRMIYRFAYWKYVLAVGKI